MIHRLMNPRVRYVKTISNDMLPKRQLPGLHAVFQIERNLNERPLNQQPPD